ncbi:MAG: GGDEF domain-containing protein [Chloroflexi bacterium]|nr:GGDEF domain-containing protein [Chloroflexota bacterium]
MTKPSDFTPERVLEVRGDPVANETKHADREAWLFRLAGVGLLMGGWAVVATHHSFGSPAFLIETIVLAGLGVFGFLAAARTVRIAVNTEKRLRLGLLVHNMELEQMAMQDDLTQLFNRHYFFERLERELETAKASQHPLSVMAMNLGGLKKINHTYGLRVGDEVLQNVGRFLLAQTRASDIPARIAGDEFAIIMPDTPAAEADTLMTRLEKRLASLNVVDRNELTLTVQASLGYATYPDAGETVDELIQQADSAMRVRKNEGESCPPSDANDGLTPVPPVFRRAESS